jgi:hypothetical protein
MGYVYEWQWEYWDEEKRQMAVTPIWMTDHEVLYDWFALEDSRSRKLEDTKRVRGGGGPHAEPPEGNFDWTREVRRRAELSRFGLPPFVTPLYHELREIWSRHKDPDVRRLALEVQTGRYTFSELAGMVAEAHFRANKPRATLEDAQKELARIRWRLLKELQRIGPIVSDKQ